MKLISHMIIVIFFVSSCSAFDQEDSSRSLQPTLNTEDLKVEKPEVENAGASNNGSPIKALELSKGASRIPVGVRSAWTVTGTYEDGSTKDLTDVVKWRVDDETILALSQLKAGYVRGEKEGATKIRATLNDQVEASRDVEVYAALLLTLRVESDETSIYVGGNGLAVRAIGVYTGGSEVDLTKTVKWSTDNDANAKFEEVVDREGILIGRLVSTSNVTALMEDLNLSSGAAIDITSAIPLSMHIYPEENTDSFFACSQVSPGVSVDQSVYNDDNYYVEDDVLRDVVVLFYSDCSYVDVSADAGLNWNLDSGDAIIDTATKVMAAGTGMLTADLDIGGLSFETTARERTVGDLEIVQLVFSHAGESPVFAKCSALVPSVVGVSNLTIGASLNLPVSVLSNNCGLKLADQFAGYTLSLVAGSYNAGADRVEDLGQVIVNNIMVNAGVGNLDGATAGSIDVWYELFDENSALVDFSAKLNLMVVAP